MLLLDVQYSIRAIIYSKLNIFPAPFKDCSIIRRPVPLLCFVVGFVMVFELFLVPVADLSCFFCI